MRLWHRVATVEDLAWTARYHDPDPARRAFGGRAEVQLAGGEVVAAELAVADAHPSAPTPSPAPTTCASWPPWPTGWSSRPSWTGSAGLVERLGELARTSPGLTVTAATCASLTGTGF